MVDYSYWDEKKSPRSMDSFISADSKHLYLSHDLMDLMDQLDNDTYHRVEVLRFETDLIHRLPENMLELGFENLKYLSISGSRFWDFDMRQVPLSVQTLVLVDQTNLQDTYINGMERLNNLRELRIPMDTFDFSDIFERQIHMKHRDYKMVTMPLIPRLRHIYFHTGMGYQKEDLVKHWKRIFKFNQLFTQIKEQITLIELIDNGDMFPVIHVSLN
jgi:hypothetical protein